MPKPTYLRFRSEAGEFSAPESRRDALVKQGAELLTKPGANSKGDPLPFKPTVLRRSPGGQEGATERKSGQKATAEKE